MPLRSSLIPQLLRPSSLFHHAHAIRTSRPSPSLWGPSGNIITFPRPTRPSPVTRLAQGTRTFPRNPVFRRAQSTRAKGPDPDPEPASLSQRLRKLSREYGWAALGVYLALSALDFPFCFAAVRLFGVDRIGHYEGVIVDTLKGMLPGRAEPDSDSAGAAEGASESQIAQAHRRNRGEEASMCLPDAS